jgi:hypothetical protein
MRVSGKPGCPGEHRISTIFRNRYEGGWDIYRLALARMACGWLVGAGMPGGA